MMIIIYLIILLLVLIFLFQRIRSLSLFYHDIDNKSKYDQFANKLTTITSNIKHISISTNNLLLDGYFLENQTSSYGIIFFPDGFGNMINKFELIKFLFNFGSIIIFDYRGYGRSEGNFNCSWNTIKEDCNAIWEYTTKQIRPDKIILFGESFGCSLAISLASTISLRLEESEYPYAIILHAPFYSLASAFGIVLRKFFQLEFLIPILEVILSNQYSSNLIKNVNYQTKIIVAHSRSDEYIPYNEGLKVFDHILPEHLYHKFYEIKGSHHHPILTEEYIYELTNILK